MRSTGTVWLVLLRGSWRWRVFGVLVLFVFVIIVDELITVVLDIPWTVDAS